jgi:hypothetical protein
MSEFIEKFLNLDTYHELSCTNESGVNHIGYRDYTKDAYDQYLKIQKEEDEYMVIEHRYCFTPLPSIIFEEKTEKTVINKATNQPTSVGSQKAKMKTKNGRMVQYTFKTPSMIAPRGFCISKTKGGDVKSIAVILDIRNPDHKYLIESIETKLEDEVVFMIYKSPGVYSCAGVKPCNTKITLEEAKKLPEWEINKRVIKSGISDLIRLPKKNETEYDYESNKRYFYINPFYYKDENSEKDAVEMNVTVFLGNGRHTQISPDALLDLCAGISYDESGNKVYGKPNGFEFFCDIVVQKLHVGSGKSIKMVCRNLYITRFFECKNNVSQLATINYINSSSDFNNINNTEIENKISTLMSRVGQKFDLLKEEQHLENNQKTNEPDIVQEKPSLLSTIPTIESSLPQIPFMQNPTSGIPFLNTQPPSF